MLHRALVVVALTTLLAPAATAVDAPVGAPAFPADDPCTEPGTCLVTVEQSEPCGVIDEIEGRTCVRHVRVTLRYLVLANGEETRVILDHEDATGEVRALNTENGWTSVREDVTVTGLGEPRTAGALAYVSASEPGAATAGQVDVAVFEGPAGASFPLAGGRVQLRDSEPVYCRAYSPVGALPVPCSLAPLHELVP